MEKPKPNPNPTQPPDGKTGQFTLSPLPARTVKAGDKVLMNVSVVRVDCKLVSITTFLSNAGISVDPPLNSPGRHRPGESGSERGSERKRREPIA